MNLRNLFCFFIMLLPGTGYSSHIIGGGLEISRSNGYNYLLTLHLYCDMHQADPYITHTEEEVINIYSKSGNQLINSYTIPFAGYETVTNKYYCHGINIIKLQVFSGSVYLDPSVYNNPDGYYAVNEQCCRGSHIDNLSTPADEGMTFYTELPSPVQEGLPFINSSPGLASWSVAYPLLNEDYYYDLSAIDPDGDSLVYSLVTPWSSHVSIGAFGDTYLDPGPAPYPEVHWDMGYSLSNIVHGTVPPEIDSATGILHLNPDTEGIFICAVKIDEYRGQNKIGSHRREFFMFVLTPHYEDCPPLAVFEDAVDMRVKIWPNPCSDDLSVEIPDSANERIGVEILNALGSVVEQFPGGVLIGAGGKLQFPVGQLAPGIYILRVKGTDRTYTGTFSKNN